jgi:hypothetical protein
MYEALALIKVFPLGSGDPSYIFLQQTLSDHSDELSITNLKIVQPKKCSFMAAGVDFHHISSAA